MQLLLITSTVHGYHIGPVHDVTKIHELKNIWKKLLETGHSTSTSVVAAYLAPDGSVEEVFLNKS